MVNHFADEPSHQKWQPMNLIDAVKIGDLEICKLLLENGADVHTDNDLVLWWAAYSGYPEVCKLLLEYGADLKVLFTARGSPLKTVFQFATEEQIEQAKKEWEIQKVMNL